MKTSPKEEPQSTLLRSVRVLFGLVEAGRPMTVTRLAAALGLPASTTHRILNVLKDAGYVAQSEDTGAYGPGPALLRASAMLSVAGTFQALVDATLAELCERTGESAFFAAYLWESQRLRFVKTLHSHHAIQYVLRPDQTFSLLWGATGDAVASRLPPDILRAIYERDKDSGEGVAAVPTWEGLQERLSQVRLQGHAISHGQRHEGSFAIAAPVVDAQGNPLGCIGIAMPASRHQPTNTAQSANLVTSAAERLCLAARSIRFPETLSS